MSSSERPLGGLVVAAALALAACTEGPFAGAGSLGELDPARVVAVGDGFLAGFTDGALFVEGQESSIPALFVDAASPGADFRQPLVADAGIALDDPTVGKLRLVRSRPLTLARAPSGAPLAAGLDRPYDNLAVPGALIAEILLTRSSATSIFGNHFYDLVLRGRGTMVQEASERDPTLVLLWLGTSDVLTFVARGGDTATAPGLPTPPATFEATYETLVEQLLPLTDQIVLFTIPDVTRFPLLQAVPTVTLNAATGDTVLITISEPLLDPVTGEPVRDEQGNPRFVQRQIPVPLLGPTGPLGPGHRLTPAALPLLAEGVGIPRVVGGTGAPLPDRVVLDPEEIVLARDAVASYNEAIRRIADEHDLAVVDVHALVEDLAAGGVLSDGVLLTNDWLRGQAFGLDGAHFTPKGYGVITNLLIDAVNARYGSRLRPIRTATLRGIPLF